MKLRLLLAALWLGLSPAAAQQFPTVPDSSVIGRIGMGGQAGPSRAVPFTALAGPLLGVRNINTTAPLAGGGPLSADLTLSINNLFIQSGNIALGNNFSALVGTTNNVFISNANALTSGDQNVVIGTGGTGGSLTVDTGNTLIGYQVAPSLHNGSLPNNFNTAIGNQAMQLCTGCGSSVAVGRAAMNHEANGAFITAVGHASLLGGTGNQQVTAIGDVAGGTAVAGAAIPGGYPNTGVNVFGLNGDTNVECIGGSCGKSSTDARFSAFAIGSYSRIPKNDNSFWLGNGMATGGTSAKFWDGTQSTTVNSNTGVTLTCAQLLSGLINRTGSASAGFTDTTPTAQQIVQCTSGAPGNGSETTIGRRFTYFNNATTQTATLAGGTGVTVSGAASATISNNGAVTWLIQITNSTLGSEAVTISTTPDPFNAGNLSAGTLPAGRMPALTGDCTTSAGAVATTCTKTNNVSFGNYATLSAGQLTNSLSGDVAINSTSTFKDGPSVAQGTTGTWWASGTITIIDPTNVNGRIFCKLWDGTTVIASSAMLSAGSATAYATMSLSGFLASPAGNIKISCENLSNTTSSIAFNQTGTSKDSTVSVFRIN